MRKMIIAVCIGLLSTWSVASGSGDREVEVTGSVQETFAPDVAYVTVYVIGEGILSVDAARDASDRLEAVVKAISELQDQSPEVEVSDVSVGDKQSRVWSSQGQTESPRPQVTKRLLITIPPHAQSAYSIIDAAIRAGAMLELQSRTRFSGDMNSTVVYGLKDDSERTRDLRAKAFEEATQRAKELAELAGKTLGQVVSVKSCGDAQSSRRVYVSGRSQSFPVEHVGTDSKGIKLSASVSATFELADP